MTRPDAALRPPAVSGPRSYRDHRRGGKSAAILAALLLAAGPALLAPSGTWLAGCQTVPVTGRTAWNLFSVTDDVQMGGEAWEQILAQERVVTTGQDAETVQRTMQRLVAVSDDAGYDWEVALLEGPDTINAFALPGGKMAVYTGLLDVAETDDGLAVVMAHEIGHVVARHGTQRLSNVYGAELVLSLLDAGNYGDLAQMVLQLVMLPYGRKQESEADEIGLIYMARAGYDPRAALDFWRRMEAAAGGGGPPEFLSTHPSAATRISRLQELMPRALEEYDAARKY